MKTKIIDTKCPYCKTEFKTSAFGNGVWAQSLWGEYSSNIIYHKCPKCGGICEVSLTCTYRYSAKKSLIK